MIFIAHLDLITDRKVVTDFPTVSACGASRGVQHSTPVHYEYQSLCESFTILFRREVGVDTAKRNIPVVVAFVPEYFRIDEVFCRADLQRDA